MPLGSRNVRTDVACGNPRVQEQQKAYLDGQLRNAIRNIKPAIDNRSPQTYPHLTSLGRDYFAKKKATTEAAFADLKMIGAIAKTMTRPSLHGDHRAGQRTKSITADHRKKELYRITMANHALLDRLENLKPVIRARDQIAQYKGTREQVANASHTARKAGLYDDLLAERKRKAKQLRSLPKVQSLPAITESSQGSILQAQAELEASKAASKHWSPAVGASVEKPQIEGSKGVKPLTKSSPMPHSQSSPALPQSSSSHGAGPDEEARMARGPKFNEDVSPVLAHTSPAVAQSSSDSTIQAPLALESNERDVMPSPMLAVTDAEPTATSDAPVTQTEAKADQTNTAQPANDNVKDTEEKREDLHLDNREDLPQEVQDEEAEATALADASIQQEAMPEAMPSPTKSTAGESYDDEDFYDDDFNGDGSGSAEENIEDSQDA